MQLLDDLEERYQINARRLNHGNHKIKCPACQPPHNSKDRPLSIEITNQKIMFFCHHCNYKGSVMSNNNRNVIPITQKTKTDIELHFYSP